MDINYIVAQLEQSSISFDEWIQRVAAGYKKKPYDYSATSWYNGLKNLCNDRDALIAFLESTQVVEPPPPPPSVEPFVGRSYFGGIWATTASGGKQANSDAMISRLVQSVGSFIMARGSYGVAAYIVDENTPRRKFTFLSGYESTYRQGRALPIMVPLPAGAKPASGSDGHITAISRDCVWDIWKGTRIDDDTWQCGHVNSLRLSARPDASYPNGFACRGASFSNGAGCVWPKEIERGLIDHPVLLILPTAAVKNTYVAPSTDSDGVYADSNTIPEGARLVFDIPDTELAKLSGYERTVAVALRDYGGIVGDKTGGTDLSIPCIAPESWTSQGQPDPWTIKDSYPSLNGLLPLLKYGRVFPWTGETLKGGSGYVSSGC